MEVRTDEVERRFAPGTTLLVRRPTPGQAPGETRSQLTVTGARWHQDRLLVRFDEVADRTAAEAVRGLLLATTVQPEVTPEDPDEFYDHQLVGSTVVTTDGSQAGIVAEVMHTGAQDLLVVRRPGRDDALVPFVAALVPEVDVAGRRIVVADRPGLLEPDPEG